MKDIYTPEETPERLDALDELIVQELGKQQQLRDMMKQWDGQQVAMDCGEVAEEKRRRARRLRLMPIVSNILSVAALMTFGFILQALIPKSAMTTITNGTSTDISPVIEHVVGGSADKTSPQAVPADSLEY
jgi:predicted nucleic acid-binding Zn ribbon protein